MGLQRVTRDLRKLQEVRGSYKGLHWFKEVTGGYRGLQDVTEGYKGLLGVNRG